MALVSAVVSVPVRARRVVLAVSVVGLMVPVIRCHELVVLGLAVTVLAATGWSGPPG